MSNEIKSRPILFSAPMVRAILDGTKSQTRRIAKLPLGFQEEFEQESERRRAHGIKKTCFVCPKGEVGDFLWVRETFVLENNREYYGEYPLPSDGRPMQHRKDGESFDGEIYEGDSYDLIPHYRATDPDPHIVPFDSPVEYDMRTRWRPSIFMPRWAARITLEITDIRVERLMDISDIDAMAEGIRPFTKDGELMKWWPCDPCDGQLKCDWADLPHSPKKAFRMLWESINSAGSWAKNPYVFAISFKRVLP